MQNVVVTRKGKSPPVPCCLFFILAREAPIAVIFRRGPSRWVQIVRWNTFTDTFEPGQWLHGRIYERRCDLSPDGSLLVYFAAKWNRASLKESETFHDDYVFTVSNSLNIGRGIAKAVAKSVTPKPQHEKRYTHAWTAVSKPPFLTALALWPKGDCWHGGGLFRDNKTLWLNHNPAVARSHKEHRPSGLRVIPNPDARGEDDPIYSMRLERDGWMLKQEWQVQYRGSPEMYNTLQPEIREKVNPRVDRAVRLTRSIGGLDYREEFVLVDDKNNRELGIERASWADWDQQGRLVVARDGKIVIGESEHDKHYHFRELADFNGIKPHRVKAPDWARKW